MPPKTNSKKTAPKKSTSKAAKRKRLDDARGAAMALEAAGKFEAAARLYQAAAALGDLAAQVSLANILAGKLPVPRPEDAVIWYKRAVQHGSASAAYHLALYYQSTEDTRACKRWLTRAAEMGDRDAKKMLKLSVKPAKPKSTKH